ncbi:uncharacterized protein LOC121771466 [Salvia splendens]|uniref:uncharacterized protein LOC121771466 n=1 Tax=Salvia splendens TaxID=180675 RepID=UPI001C27FA94|nr:uncharacterized protein LOC121771466 [Salvia splendens]
MEKLKAPETVSRIFSSTRPCTQPVVDTPTRWDDERQFASFWTIFFEEALGAGYNKLDKLEMLLFPIWGERHQYVVCFDVPDGKMNIIDHSLAESHASFSYKYGNTPSLLRKFMGAALDKCKETKLSDLVRSWTTNVVTMPWRNNVVTMENGVYVMRHMETYFGEKEKDWDCGLSAK